MSEAAFLVQERQGGDPWEKRFVLVDKASGKVIDDAQGYGYKTRQNAIKAGWYKFSGGKKSKDDTEKKATSFWKRNKPFAKAINDYFETNFKEIARGESDPDIDTREIAVEMGIDGFDKKFLEYLK